ncbi:reverse transcriptase [Gossypium australe]|uniref:Reverse transcriptase n=1 Tax=Gossypium australe TaxID=47621 RepID=A0A5B6V830_9ROSI|nr:reverse transcriptase [Gossypium australe]
MRKGEFIGALARIFLLINYPNSLLAKVLKEKYYPKSNFLEAQLGTLPSLTWKSIWAAKGLLQKGLCWQIGRGNKVSIWNNCWIQGIELLERHNSSDKMQLELVSDLIDNANRKWRAELISNTFHPNVARIILQIPLSESDHEDFQVWRGEPTGEYSVRSAYKLLQNANLDPSNYLLQTEIKEFFGKLWNLQLPSKISIIIWRISWNYIPTLGNLRYKRIVTNASCPCCGYGEEDCHHIFR